jgi:type 1 fimbria pilin
MASLSAAKKMLVVGVATAGLIGASTASASASSTYEFGGNVVAGNCEAWIISDGNSWNWAVGIVEGGSNCVVELEQENINNPNGPHAFTAWSFGETTSLYHNDGVHKLRAWVSNGVGGGPGKWVN